MCVCVALEHNLLTFLVSSFLFPRHRHPFMFGIAEKGRTGGRPKTFVAGLIESNESKHGSVPVRVRVSCSWLPFRRGCLDSGMKMGD